MKLFRTVMRRHHDAAKPIWLTEVSWPAARGRLDISGGLLSVITTDAGMARRLTGLYREALRLRRTLRLQRVYWYSWGCRTSRAARSSTTPVSGCIATACSRPSPRSARSPTPPGADPPPQGQTRTTEGNVAVPGASAVAAAGSSGVGAAAR